MGFLLSIMPLHSLITGVKTSFLGLYALWQKILYPFVGELIC